MNRVYEGMSDVHSISQEKQQTFFLQYLLFTLLSLLIIATPAFSQPLSEHAIKVIGPKSYESLRAAR